ncbi:unnamed protein product [Tilletia controversa]|uniref:Cell division cycle protein 123 n=3 Tax=Tilletia TaxID=13289 RepID=A0A8X7SVY2_9BASI|nr:hypothetical protein CF336_g4710 [Tilletia laevis]KAE8195796.1 hypothetical protein CF328_g4322 [Tilletia controversa]KAE8259666.1 hypothetical protein A4X03_0g4034 [Tilletia caries]KAE8200822.1 hypothetical protein CF335_g3872 [Tilletia laevis]KAE8246395.1 hypothetical protein A4X06_0g5034 [Tilletia controversa]
MPDVTLRAQSESQALPREVAATDEAGPSPADALRLTAFPRWYPFHRSHAPKATVINLAELQPEFIPWLESGSFVLPEDPKPAGLGEDHGDDEDEHSGIEASDLSARRRSGLDDDPQGREDQDEEEDELPAPTFPALHKRLCELIEKYDGAVFPKLNWSAPRDAAWIVPGATLRCTSPQDIYLLLKSSDFVATDIAQTRELYLDAAFSSLSLGSITVDPEAAAAATASSSTTTRSLPPLQLVIKQHFAFPTSHEFRCFVHRRRLLAISQRDTATAFPHLQPAQTRRTIRRLIKSFWRSRLDLAPPQPGSEGSSDAVSPTALLRDYVFDVYLTRDMSRVFLVDLAPWGIARTDPLLWNWDELEEKSEHYWARRQPGSDQAAGDEEEEEDDESDDEAYDDDDEPLPPLRVLSSDQDDPSANLASSSSSSAAQSHSFSNTPTYAHNMVPADFHALASATAGPAGAGKTLEQLREEWAAAVARASVDDGEEEKEDGL